MSTLASVFRDYDRFTRGRYVLIRQSQDLADQHVYSLEMATIGLGWVMTFLVGVHTCLGVDQVNETLIASRHTSL